MADKSLLVGVYDGNTRSLCVEISSRLDYDTVAVGTFDAMRREFERKDFYRYVMDANLGNPDTTNIESAIEMYKKVVDRFGLEAKEIFRAVSSDPQVVQLARKHIPTRATEDFLPHDFKSFLQYLA